MSRISFTMLSLKVFSQTLVCCETLATLSAKNPIRHVVRIDLMSTAIVTLEMVLSCIGSITVAALILDSGVFSLMSEH